MENDNYIVYMHTVPNGRRYIGITHQEPERRWRGGMHYNYNKRFFLVIVKYGWDNIKHEILYKNLSEEEAIQKEMELIAKYKTNQEEYGYNMTTGGKGAPNCTKSIETREKLSKANKGKKHTEEAKRKIGEAHKGLHLGGKSPSAKKVLQYDLDGNFIKEWDSFMDIQRELGVSYQNIWRVCNNKRESFLEYIWKYKDEETRVKKEHNDKMSKTSITFNNKTQSLVRWSEELNIPDNVLWARLNQLHWTVEKAFTQPYKKNKKRG
jgi:group I intron endonuclease